MLLDQVGNAKVAPFAGSGTPSVAPRLCPASKSGRREHSENDLIACAALQVQRTAWPSSGSPPILHSDGPHALLDTITV